MLRLLLILCAILCYFALEGGIENYSYWLGGVFALVTIFIFLISLTIKNPHSEQNLTSCRAVNSIDYLTGISFILLLSLIIYLTSSLTPKSLQALYYHSPILKNNLTTDHTDQKSLAYTEDTLTGSVAWSETGNTISTGPILRSSNHPEIFLETETRADAETLSTAPIYIRDYSANTFDGLRWKSARHGRSILEPINHHPIQISPPNQRREKAIPHTIYRSYYPDQANTMASLQGIQHVSQINRLTKISNGIFLLPSPKEGENSYQYKASSSPLNFNHLITKPTNLQAGNTLPIYLQASENEALAQPIRLYAEPFKNKTSVTQTLQSLREHLQNSCEYNLKTSQLRKKNPIQGFLTSKHPGYCLHFATATTLIVRELGIPSRITYGWTGGTYYPLNNQFVFLAKEAHAWCEIYLKDYGWVIFDTTPPNATLTTSKVAKEKESPPIFNQPQNKPSPAEQKDLARQQTPKFSWFPILLSTICLTIISAVLLTVRFRHRETTRKPSIISQRKQMNYLSAFQLQSTKHGYPIITGRTIRQHIEILHKSNIHEPFFELLLDYHYGLIYQHKKPDPAMEQTLMTMINAWSPKKNNS